MLLWVWFNKTWTSLFSWWLYKLLYIWCSWRTAFYPWR